MSLAQTSRFAISEAIIDRLEELDGLSVYFGEVPDAPPVIQTNGEDDPSGRVAPYVVLWPGQGIPDLNPSLSRAPGDLLWSGQTTVAAGYGADCTYTLDRVWGKLYHWSPEVEGLKFGFMAPPEGFDPGPIRKDDTVTPVRFFVPLLWRLLAV